jgi:hypothetical protein
MKSVTLPSYLWQSSLCHTLQQTSFCIVKTFSKSQFWGTHFVYKSEWLCYSLYMKCPLKARILKAIFRVGTFGKWLVTKGSHQWIHLLMGSHLNGLWGSSGNCRRWGLVGGSESYSWRVYFVPGPFCFLATVKWVLGLDSLPQGRPRNNGLSVHGPKPLHHEPK